MRRLGSHRHQRGVGMLEISLALAAIAILLIAATRYYQQASVGSGVNDAITMIENTQSATQNWAFGRTDGFSSVSKSELISHGLLPSEFSGANINPFGGNLTVAGNAATFDITLTDVPEKACAQLISKMEQSTNSISPATPGACGANQTMTFTYGNN